jgi:hypothetical protein
LTQAGFYLAGAAFAASLGGSIFVYSTPLTLERRTQHRTADAHNSAALYELRNESWISAMIRLIIVVLIALLLVVAVSLMAAGQLDSAPPAPS